MERSKREEGKMVETDVVLREVKRGKLIEVHGWYRDLLDFNFSEDDNSFKMVEYNKIKGYRETFCEKRDGNWMITGEDSYRV